MTAPGSAFLPLLPSHLEHKQGKGIGQVCFLTGEGRESLAAQAQRAVRRGFHWVHKPPKRDDYPKERRQKTQKDVGKKTTFSFAP